MRTIITLAIILIFSGCATSYQPKGITGGFSSTQIDTNAFTVKFKGNGYTSKEKANDYTLLRSAEITIENGYKYFSIINAQKYSKNSTYTTPITANTSIKTNTYGSAYGNNNTTTYNENTYGTATTTLSGGQTYTISKPRTSNTIVCFTEKPPGFSYNAKFIIKNLKLKYGINK